MADPGFGRQTSSGEAADPGFGLKIHPATILRSLLQQYPSGGQFFLEALQNADDTGRATKFCALLDYRKHPVHSLRSPQARGSLQSESILFYDDAGFQTRDWRSLQFMCDSVKRASPYEAGHFGMGSRSFFHITDVLQVLSGSMLAALDPDDILETGHFGEQIDFTQQGWLEKFPDEGAPFLGLFGCDMRSPLKGTIIRAALRSRERASSCSFMPHAVDLDRAERIFRDFEETLKNGEVLLFLSCVRTVELWRRDASAADATLLARCQLGISSGHSVPGSLHSSRELRSYLEQFKTFAELGKSLRRSDITPPETQDVVELTMEHVDSGAGTKTRRWLRYGAFIRDDETLRLSEACESVPVITLALPLDKQVDGYVFTMLPLPLSTGLPVHVNAHFRLHSNRRAIWHLTSDLEGEHRVWGQWNERLLTDAVPCIYSRALQWLATNLGAAADYGQPAWPRDGSVEKAFAVMLDPLVRLLKEMSILVVPDKTLVKPVDALYFPTPTSALEAHRQELLHLCFNRGHKVVDPPEHVVSLLHKRKALCQKDCKWVLLTVVLPAASSLEKTQLASLLICFLEWAGTWKEDELTNLGKELAGVPWVLTEGGVARTIGDCFDPEHAPQAFSVVQQRQTQIQPLLTDSKVNIEVIWRMLRRYGVKAELTWDDAVEEAEAVVKDKDVQRAGQLYAHVDKRHWHLSGDRKSALKRLQAVPWVPATEPSKDASPPNATQLLALPSLFPSSAHKVVWAVAPTLCVEAEPSLQELRPGRNIEKEPGVLVEQVRVLIGPLSAVGSSSEGGAEKALPMTATLEHLRAVFGALARTRILSEVIMPAVSGLPEDKVAILLLAFLDFAASWREAEIQDVRRQLAEMKWIPVEDGTLRAISDCFDPEQSPEAFRVVQQRRTKLDARIADATVSADRIFKVLRLCGLKKELTWEDAVEEAESVMQDKDLQRAGQLLAHLDKQHAKLHGNRTSSMLWLKKQPWVPARAPSRDSEGQVATELLALPSLFPKSAHKLIWAVAPSLCTETEPSLHDLRPCRNIQSEPKVLVEQIRVLVASASAESGAQRRTPEATLQHLRAVFEALPPGRVLSEVALPAVSGLTGKELSTFLLIFLEWAGSWKQDDINELSRKVADIRWVPVEDGTTRAISDCFDPDESPQTFSIVRARLAKINELIVETGVSSTTVWRVLRLCGLKQEMTWEDAVEEAERVMKDGDLHRGDQLYSHISKQHAKMRGGRAGALKKLQSLPWLPATEHSIHADTPKATQLLALSQVFPASEHKLIWAVAPSLCIAVEPSVPELRPGRNIASETSILVEQVRGLVKSVFAAEGDQIAAFVALSKHLRAVFSALAPLRIFSEVVSPVTTGLSERGRAMLLLTFLDWLSSLPENDIKDVGRRLASLEWLPVEDGASLAIGECFDPEHSPEGFGIVQKRRAKVGKLITDLSLRTDAVHRVLRLCGIKQGITWEDSKAEAESIVQEKDVARAGKLFAHLHKHHSQMKGNRSVVLRHLQSIAWVPAKQAALDPGSEPAVQLAKLSEVFPASARKITWAVAPALHAEVELAVHELRPGRKIEAETGVLVKQVRAICESLNSDGQPQFDPKAVWEHLRVVFGSLSPTRLLAEVVLPAASEMQNEKLQRFILIFLEWTGARKNDEISEVGRKLSKIQWMPVQSGTTHAITECFDPEHSPFSFTVVKRRRVQLDGLIAASTVDASVIWRVLRLCGMKKEISWEEAVEEAEAIIADADIKRAGLLFEHICKFHGQLGGNRTAALKKLQKLPWVPATAPSSEGEATDATQLLSLQDVFPASVRKLVWAVAPTLCVESQPKLSELKPCCSVESKPDILAKQVRALVNSALVDGDVKMSAYVAKLADLRAVFGSISSARILSEAILPVVSDLGDKMRTMLLLTFLAWAAALPETEVKPIGKKLSTIEWLPVADGSLRAIGEAFDPEESMDAFSVVQQRKAKVSDMLADIGLEAEAVYTVFRLCGIKQGISWQDAVQEAEAIIKDADVERAGQLFEHLHENHPSMAGNRRSALDKLQDLAWVPASEPSSGAEPPESPKPTQLLALHEMLPPAAGSLVWSVVPCLCTTTELTLHELRPHRSIEDEPDLLIEQVVAIAEFAAKSSTKPPGDADGEGGKTADEVTAGPAETKDGKGALPTPPCVSDTTLKHLRAVLSALTPHLESLPSLDEHPRLKGMAFVPCMPADASSGGAALFTPRRTAFHAKHDHRALHPAFGILNPMDSTVRMLAEGINVSRELRAEELAGALKKLPGGEESADLSVTLTIELASRVRAGETKPVRMVVPTASGELKPVGDVYIDDAPWREGESMKLHPRISAEDGRLLGCTSVRLEMARQCEAAPLPGAPEEEDPFGQEADLVSVVKQLLQEYGDDADLVKEFVQNADDAGTNTIAFFLQDETFGTERVVDPRTAELQGAALYICTDMALTADDIQRMQRVGTSAKRMDANTSGRFGVGMNVMYRFCDCPQLWANSHLHYFDLTQSFVANRGMRRGRKFTTEKLSQNFPDSYTPFTSEELPGTLRAFPTIFRLALRTKRSELGVERDMPSVLEELRGVAQIADKMLMFTRHLNRMEFYYGAELLASHFTDVDDQEAHETFWMGVPAASKCLKPGQLSTHMEQMKITTECPEGEISTAEWVITHRVGVTDKAMSDLLREQLDKPHGVALVPHGAAAVRVKPFEETMRAGKICCGLPLPAFSNCSAWVHGSFGLLSSRKAMPLPEESEAKPQLDKLWNKKLIQGPVAEAMHGLILHCSGLVHWGTITLEQYFSLFPIRGDRFQTLLATATFKCALSSAIYPACRAEKIFWVSGPAPAFFVPRELSTGVQKALVNDGMKLVQMPDELILEYEEARGLPREHLSSSELVTFLREAFAKLYKDDLKVEMQLEESKMDSLKTKAFIVEMLAFTCKGLWKDHLEKCQANPMMLHRFSMADLNGLPLLLTHDSTVTAFGSDKIKYTTWRELLKEKKDIFIDKDANRALVNAVDTTAEGINKVVQVEIPGIRPFTLKDLLPYKEKVVDSLHPELPFTKSENEPLRLLWNLIAESAGSESNVSILQKGKAERWIDMIMDWEILPVHSRDGLGESGETCLPMDLAGTCVAVTALDTDPSVVTSLTKIVQQCGIPTVQHELLGDERVSKILKPVLVSTNEELLKLLIDHGEFEDLTGEHRHDLLLYFSVLCIKGLQLQQVARLPLFKTAAVESKFTCLTDGLQPCCIDPADPHANALCLLAQPFLVLLAWPTAQVKPIYEYFGVVLGSGEDLFINYIIPELPTICIQDEDGSMSEPFLLELHAYVCIENSEKVKRAASDCPFVPTADHSSHGMARQFISTAKGGAAAAFAEVLSPFLAPWWMQKSEEQVELLHALGMGSTLSPSMILLCAKHLETLAGTSDPQVAGNAQEPVETAAPDSSPDNALEDTERGDDTSGTKVGSQKLLAPKSKRLPAPLMKPAMKRIPAPKKKSATAAAPSEDKEPAGEDAEKEAEHDDVAVDTKPESEEEADFGGDDDADEGKDTPAENAKAKGGGDAEEDEDEQLRQKKKRKTESSDSKKEESTLALKGSQAEPAAGEKDEELAAFVQAEESNEQPNADPDAPKIVRHEVRVMSFELVEELCRATAELLPKPHQHKLPVNQLQKALPDITNSAVHKMDTGFLREAAACRILLARRHKSMESKVLEIQARTMQKQRDMFGFDHGDVELVSFAGTALNGTPAAQLLWTVSPVDDHYMTVSESNQFYMKALMEQHGTQMNTLFGVFVAPHHAPTDLVLQHLTCLCTYTEIEQGEATVKPNSATHDDLRACWTYFAEYPDSLDDSDVQAVLNDLRNVPCIAVSNEDVADRPSDQIPLAMPRHSFFQLPSFTGKEANLRRFLHQVRADDEKSASVFRALGARQRPGAADFAEASERVAQKAKSLGRTNWEWVVACLEACARGVHDDVQQLLRAGIPVQVESLHMFTMDNEIEKCGGLVWADVPRWLSRCGQERTLKFCRIGGDDARDVAKTLVSCAGVRELSNLIEERRLYDTEDEKMKRGVPDNTSPIILPSHAGCSVLKTRVEQLLQSQELASGMRAVILHSQDGQYTLGHSLTQVHRELCTIKFQIAIRSLRSALYWKASTGNANGEAIIPGSAQDQQVYFDDAEKSVYIRAECTNGQDDTFIAELVFALRRTLPLLWKVDSFLLEALLRCALRTGPAGIAEFLEKRDIKASNFSRGHLGPGDPLPEDLHDHVVWSMDATFGEGEPAAILVADAFIIVEVAKWPGEQQPGKGLSKSYNLRVSSDDYETRKHFEIYKVRGHKEKSTSQAQSTSFALVPAGEAAHDVFEEVEAAAEDGDQSFSASDAKHIADVKRYLHEMADLDAAEYKVVMRRLFKTWHPDKVGDTPLSNTIFRMLRRHETWFKKRLAGEAVGDDSWLDEEDGGKENGTSASGKLLELEGRTYQPMAGGVGTWFDEFAKEMRQAKFAAASKSWTGTGHEPRVVLPGERFLKPDGTEAIATTTLQIEQPGIGGPRVVDKVFAPRWLQQARLELVAARRLLQPIEGVRALPAAAVWHCEQAVEMAIKAAMFRTCGVSEDETYGHSAHDIVEFVRRLRTGRAITEEQKHAQQVPVDDEDVQWLKNAYLNARYPRPWEVQLPAVMYNMADAERALLIAEVFIAWADDVEDLPDPGKDLPDAGMQFDISGGQSLPGVANLLSQGTNLYYSAEALAKGTPFLKAPGPNLNPVVVPPPSKAKAADPLLMATTVGPTPVGAPVSLMPGMPGLPKVPSTFTFKPPPAKTGPTEVPPPKPVGLVSEPAAPTTAKSPPSTDAPQSVSEASHQASAAEKEAADSEASKAAAADPNTQDASSEALPNLKDMAAKAFSKAPAVAKAAKAQSKASSSGTSSPPAEKKRHERKPEPQPAARPQAPPHHGPHPGYPHPAYDPRYRPPPGYYPAPGYHQPPPHQPPPYQPPPHQPPPHQPPMHQVPPHQPAPHQAPPHTAPHTAPYQPPSQAPTQPPAARPPPPGYHTQEAHPETQAAQPPAPRRDEDQWRAADHPQDRSRSRERDARRRTHKTKRRKSTEDGGNHRKKERRERREGAARDESVDESQSDSEDRRKAVEEEQARGSRETKKRRSEGGAGAPSSSSAAGGRAVTLKVGSEARTLNFDEELKRKKGPAPSAQAQDQKRQWLEGRLAELKKRLTERGGPIVNAGVAGGTFPAGSPESVLSDDEEEERARRDSRGSKDDHHEKKDKKRKRKAK